MAYRALMSGRLIFLEKCFGVRSVSVGDTSWRMLAKCLMVVTGAEATEACRTKQLCGGLEAGIEGNIYLVRLLW